MPNIVAHYICGKLVAKKLNIKDDDYLKGNLYPDYIDKDKHYRIQGKIFEIPDLDKFIQEEKISNKYFKLGFLTHLMLDKLFLDGFVIDDIYTKLDKNINIFESDKIYLDYTNMSKTLMNYYHLNFKEIDDLMLKEKNIDIKKYKSNVEVIKDSTTNNLKYIDINHFINFLESAANQVYIYIKEKKIL